MFTGRDGRTETTRAGVGRVLCAGVASTRQLAALLIAIALSSFVHHFAVDNAAD